jgi:L-rhamnose mutarotase
MNDGSDELIYPSSASVLKDAGLSEIEVYIQRRRDTVFNFVNNRDIYRECLELETDVENSEHVYWWKKSFNLAYQLTT